MSHASGEADPASGDASILRSEEELIVSTREIEAGHVRIRTAVDSERVSEVVARDVEHLGDIERVDIGDEDSGEIEELEDGSISIPIFEERLVITKQLVVRERVIVRKTTRRTEQEVHAELRHERATSTPMESSRSITDRSGRWSVCFEGIGGTPFAVDNRPTRLET